VEGRKEEQQEGWKKEGIHVIKVGRKEEGRGCSLKRKGERKEEKNDGRKYFQVSVAVAVVFCCN